MKRNQHRKAGATRNGPSSPGKKGFGGPRVGGKPATSPTDHAPKMAGTGGHELLYGWHAVRAAWLNPLRRCHALWLSEAANTEFAPLQREAKQRGLTRPAASLLPPAALDKQTGQAGAVHQGVVLQASPLPATDILDVLEAAPRVLLLLDQVTDPHNVGAILRSAAAFGAGAVVATARHAAQHGGTLAKAASGALELVPLVSVVNLAQTLELLQKHDYWCVGLAGEVTTNLADAHIDGKVALVLGAEGEGLRQLTRQRCNQLARLPTNPNFPSVNVSNAAAVALATVAARVKA